SGPVAARAYDELAAARGVVRRVVMLGPVHRVPVRGLALPGADAFATPLGTVPIDRGACRSVQGLSQVVTSDPAHALEHSLEVQLPFLQKILGEFALVPLAVGTANVAERSEEHTSELQSRENLVCRLLLEKKKQQNKLYSITDIQT